MFLLWKAISFRVVEGLIMPLQRSDVPEGILLKLNNNNKSGRQDRECDFFVYFFVLLEVLAMERQIFAWISLFFPLFFCSGMRYFYLQ